MKTGSTITVFLLIFLMFCVNKHQAARRCVRNSRMVALAVCLISTDQKEKDQICPVVPHANGTEAKACDDQDQGRDNPYGFPFNESFDGGK